MASKQIIAQRYLLLSSKIMFQDKTSVGDWLSRQWSSFGQSKRPPVFSVVHHVYYVSTPVLLWSPTKGPKRPKRPRLRKRLSYGTYGNPYALFLRSGVTHLSPYIPTIA
jgi:hypothetical protein